MLKHSICTFTLFSPSQGVNEAVFVGIYYANLRLACRSPIGSREKLRTAPCQLRQRLTDETTYVRDDSLKSRWVMSYTHEGVRVVRGLTPMTRRVILIPWDSVRTCVLKHTRMRVTRYSLSVREGVVPLVTPGCGLLRRSDLGRVLVVDRLPDGRWVDVLV